MALVESMNFTFNASDPLELAALSAALDDIVYGEEQQQPFPGPLPLSVSAGFDDTDTGFQQDQDVDEIGSVSDMSRPGSPCFRFAALPALTGPTIDNSSAINDEEERKWKEVSAEIGSTVVEEPTAPAPVPMDLDLDWAFDFDRFAEERNWEETLRRDRPRGDGFSSLGLAFGTDRVNLQIRLRPRLPHLSSRLLRQPSTTPPPPTTLRVFRRAAPVNDDEAKRWEEHFAVVDAADQSSASASAAAATPVAAPVVTTTAKDEEDHQWDGFFTAIGDVEAQDCSEEERWASLLEADNGYEL
ncbi:uncharacterized protein B0T15DRAFT_500898 [Chaetomium strumarium]|uniref:Uncharacterized protein n=1 Tax=Chaetomium strumarium TaxID=1170767 RepID=A0AAJ0H0C5_9PEZI|nr:hypothetical protein B0T15DRAFT_500898 [Chaetomium strumarium]